jgi:hypothetical protein
MARGYFIAISKFYPLISGHTKDFLDSCGHLLRSNLAREIEIVVQAGEDYAATFDYRVDRVSVAIKKGWISRVDLG